MIFRPEYIDLCQFHLPENGHVEFLAWCRDNTIHIESLAQVVGAVSRLTFSVLDEMKGWSIISFMTAKAPLGRYAERVGG